MPYYMTSNTTITRGLNDANKQSFFQRTVILWNSLPNQRFPKNYNVDLFKKRCYTYFIARRAIKS